MFVHSAVVGFLHNKEASKFGTYLKKLFGIESQESTPLKLLKIQSHIIYQNVDLQASKIGDVCT